MVEENKDAYVSTLILFELKSLCSSSHSISTSVRDDSYLSGEFFIQMKMDDEENNEVTTFYAGDYVYILVCASHNYECYTTGDDLTKKASNIIEEYVDDLVFAKASEATLAYPPTGNVQYEWIGRDPNANPVFDGMKVSLTKNVTGMLRCTYDVAWDRWEVHHGKVATIITTAYIPDTEAIAYLSIDFLSAEGVSISGPQAWELMVLDYCNDQPVEGVAITLGGSPVGVTDSAGLIFLGQLNPAEYTLKMTKTDYIDSDLDKLHNDKIIIP